jgi:DNA repair protein SbcD/Mre11
MASAFAPPGTGRLPKALERVMRILLVSDVHLDSPFAWAKPEVARRRRQALRDALARSIQLGIDQRVDAICCGGDLFEHERVSPDTSQFLKSQFEAANPIPIFIAPGNHDWLGPESLYRRVRWSPNVRVFEDSRLVPATIAEGLTLWGAAHLAPAGTPNFLQNFKVDRSGVHLALFHGAEIGSVYLDEPGKQPHAPFKAEEIDRSGLQFALLGHYHSPRDEARFTYPGNPEPLTFGEHGQRGAVIATVEQDGRVKTERHTVAGSAVHDVEIDVGGCSSKQEIRQRIAETLQRYAGYARVTLVGEVAPEVELCAADFEDLGQNLEAPPLVRHHLVTIAYDLTKIAQEATVRGQFVRDVQGSGLTHEERQRVIVTGLRALDGRSDLEVL